MTLSNIRYTISQIITCQGRLEVNPSVLIGSCSVCFLAYGPFSRKRSCAVYFWSQKPEYTINKFGPSAIYYYLLTSLARFVQGKDDPRSLL